MALGLFFDIFVGLVVLISVSVAFLRGFIRETLTILGIGGGIAASYVGGPLLMPFMRGWMGITEASEGEEAEKILGVLDYATLSDVLSYVVVFIVFVILLSVLSHFLAEAAKNLGLGALDRTLGVVFGLARSAVVLGLLYLPVLYLAGDEQKETWFEGSHSQVYVQAASGWINGFFSDELKESVAEGAEQLEGSSTTRKTLEALDVLPSGEEIKDMINPDKAEEKKDGYTPDFRDAMDKLIEDNTDNSPSYNE